MRLRGTAHGGHSERSEESLADGTFQRLKTLPPQLRVRVTMLGLRQPCGFQGQGALLFERFYLVFDKVLQRQREKYLGKLRVELGAAKSADLSLGPCRGHGLAIGPFADHGIKAVGKHHHSSSQGNLLALKASWVSVAVKMLVMGQHALGDLGHLSDSA